MRDCFILLKSDAGSPAVSSAGRTIILLRWGNLSEHIEYTLRSWAWPCPHLSRLGLACDQINGCVWRLEQSSDCLRQYYRYGGRQDYQSSGCLRRCCSPGSMPVEAVLPSRNLSLLLCPHQTSHCCPALTKLIIASKPSPNQAMLLQGNNQQQQSNTKGMGQYVEAIPEAVSMQKGKDRGREIMCTLGVPCKGPQH